MVQTTNGGFHKGKSMHYLVYKIFKPVQNTREYLQIYFIFQYVSCKENIVSNFILKVPE